MIITIDGPAGSGKSTVARRLAERLGFRHVDTGAMYRALAWLALLWEIPLDDEDKLGELASGYPVAFADGLVYIAGFEVSAEIRSPRVDEATPEVARHPQVRALMRAHQRELCQAGDSVVEGRDIGTVVLPDAPVKVYLTAAPVERARRRTAEQGTADEASLHRRDKRDSVRLQPAGDATVIDTTHLTIDEVVARLERLVQAR